MRVPFDGSALYKSKQWLETSRLLNVMRRPPVVGGEGEGGEGEGGEGEGGGLVFAVRKAAMPAARSLIRRALLCCESPMDRPEYENRSLEK